MVVHSDIAPGSTQHTLQKGTHSRVEDNVQRLQKLEMRKVETAEQSEMKDAFGTVMRGMIDRCQKGGNE